jgi:hypothetical protein
MWKLAKVPTIVYSGFAEHSKFPMVSLHTGHRSGPVSLPAKTGDSCDEFVPFAKGPVSSLRQCKEHLRFHRRLKQIFGIAVRQDSVLLAMYDQ